MSQLTTKQRKNLKPSSFVFPSRRAYPIQDAAHARDALARVAQNGSPTEKAAVRRAVARKFPGIVQDHGANVNHEAIRERGRKMIADIQNESRFMEGSFSKPITKGDK